jgi:hypothetical protein
MRPPSVICCQSCMIHHYWFSDGMKSCKIQWVLWLPVVVYIFTL